MNENRRILRELIYLAHEGGYDGPGADWDSAPSAELDKVLEAGAHVPVLKSARFARPFFWHILYPEAATVGSGAAGDEESSEERDEIEGHVAALGDQLAESDDPLAFLQQYLSE
jgi:hypothetical protein